MQIESQKSKSTLEKTIKMPNKSVKKVKMDFKSTKWSILIYFMNQIFNESEVTLKFKLKLQVQ